MGEAYQQAARKVKRSRKVRSFLAFACVFVMLVTSLSLMNQADTMEWEAVACALEEHVHTEDCYVWVTDHEETEDVTYEVRTLDCTFQPHVHTALCADGGVDTACGLDTRVYHTHDALCYDADGNLVCTLPELREHTHTAGCYETVRVLVCGQEESDGHTHTDACFVEAADMSRAPVCGLVESQGHAHTENCYGDILVCGQTEQPGHVHTESCVRTVLSCTIPESEGHHHTEACEVQRLTCGLQESAGHVHTDACYEDRITCGLEAGEGAHTHTDACYAWEDVLVCGQDGVEGHEHTAACYERFRGDLTCNREESAGHVHTESCHSRVLVCTIREGAGAHTHNASCYETEYTCGLSEGEGRHAHTDDCYTVEYICGKHEGEGAHVHTDSCYERGLVCGKEVGQGAHTHTEACYPKIRQLICDQAEAEGHIHTGNCYETQKALTCDFALVHEHTEDCIRDGVYVCGFVEIKKHQHTEECFKVETIVLQKGHRHTDRCYVKTLICGKSEHVHTERCLVVQPDAGEAQEEGAWQAGKDTDEEKAEDSEPSQAAQVLGEDDAGMDLMEIGQDETDADGWLEEGQGTESQSQEEPNETAEEGLEAPDVPGDDDGTGLPVNGSPDAGEEADNEEKQDTASLDLVMDGEAVPSSMPVDEQAADGAEDPSAEEDVSTPSDLPDDARETEDLTEMDNSTDTAWPDEQAMLSAEALEEPSAENAEGPATASDLDAVTDMEEALSEDEDAELADDADELLLSTPSDLPADGTGASNRVLELGLASITAIGDELPEGASGSAVILDGSEAEEAASLVEAFRTRASGLVMRARNRASSRVSSVQYKVLDISLHDVEQSAYEQGFRVDVRLPEAIVGSDFRLFHIHDGEVIEITAPNLQLDERKLSEDISSVSGFTFVTENFSQFVLSYTVDFHFEVSGKTVEFSIPGGGFTTLTHIVEVLGIAEADKHEDLDAAQAAKEFVSQVADVSFSDDTLVSVSKAEEDTTVGAIRERLGLVCEYSAELSEEEIEEINGSVVTAGDWVLISLKPFTSDETLTVKMVNGDEWTVRVTDAVNANTSVTVNYIGSGQIGTDSLKINGGQILKGGSSGMKPLSTNPNYIITANTWKSFPSTNQQFVAYMIHPHKVHFFQKLSFECVTRYSGCCSSPKI